jgi:hypothetical protein
MYFIEKSEGKFKSHCTQCKSSICIDVICTYIICLTCKANPGSNNYLTSLFVCLCVPLLLVLQSAAFYGGSGKVYLEDAASRIPTVKISKDLCNPT